MEGNKLWVQQVSIAPSTVRDVICLKELLEVKLQQSQAMEVGLCPQRMGLYSQCFGEEPAVMLADHCGRNDNQ